LLRSDGSIQRSVVGTGGGGRSRESCVTRLWNERASLIVPLCCPALLLLLLRHSSRSSAPTTCSIRPAMGSSFSDAHPAMSAHEQLRAPHACEQRISSSRLLRRSAEPALVYGCVLRVGSCDVVAGDIVWVSCDARTEGARRRRAHGRAQGPQDKSGR